MAHYSFLKDLDDGKKAEQIAIDFLGEFFMLSEDTVIELLPRERQNEGDIEVTHTYADGVSKSWTYEVKYDIMSEKTGNFCFEIANDKGPTGIAATKANCIIYVVPSDNGHNIYLFSREPLLTYLFSGAKEIREVKGGDRRAYIMLLVNRDVLMANVHCRKDYVLNA